MQKIFAASLYSGGGLSTYANEKIELGWGCEADKAIAEVHCLNAPSTKILEKNGKLLRVEQIDPHLVDFPDLIWISQECKGFSSLAMMNSQHRSRMLAKDMEEAQRINECLHLWQPRIIILENAVGYLESSPYHALIRGLRNKYYCREEIISPNDLGFPQHRPRSLVRLVRSDAAIYLPPTLAHRLQSKSAGTESSVPAESLHPTWEEVIGDGITPFPLANWQVKALEAQFQSPAFWQKFLKSKPIMLVQRAGATDNIRTAIASEPCWSIRALGGDRHWRQVDYLKFDLNFIQRLSHFARLSHPQAQTLLDSATSYSVSPRGLARLQGLPDSYILPADPVIATKIVGNGVHREVAYRAISETIEFCY